jgi:ketosteroid isomerase-like protein
VSQARNIKRVVEATEVFNSEGGGALMTRYDEFFTEDFRWVSGLVGMVEGGEYRGREGFAAYWSDFQASFDSMEFQEPSFEAVGEDTVLVLGRIRLRGHESGVPLEQDIGWVFHLDDDGKVVAGETHLTQDAARAAAAEGARA